MKKIVTLLSIFTAACCYAQQPVSWEKKIGGVETEYANAVDTGATGTMYAAGFIRSRSGEYIMQYPGPDVLSPDAWIVKYNRHGVIEWQKCFGGTNPDEFFDVKATPDGGVIAVGRSGSTDGNITNNKGGEDIVVAKYDAAGNLQWNKNYGTTLLDGARTITLMPDGSYVLGCYSNGNNTDLIGGKGGRDIWLIQISATGTIIRKKNFGGSSEDDVYDVKIYNNDRWVLTGSTGSINGDVTGNHGSTDAWVVKLNADWSIIKQKCFGSTGQDIGNGIVVLPGGFAVAARVNANNGDVTGLKGGYDGFMIKTDTSFNIIWSKTYGGSSNDYFSALILTPDGNLMATGETSSIDGDISTNAGLSDAWLLKMDTTAGGIVWSKTFGGNRADRASDMLLWGNDDYLFTGMFSYTIPNTATTHPQLWIVTSKILPINGTLPVKIISFNGQNRGGINILNWQTSEEINSKEYKVERSVNGNTFSVIGTIPAGGNSGRLYSFTDIQPANKSWYRLRMIDVDGHQELSNIILIQQNEKQNQLRLYPSLANASVTVEITTVQNQLCQLFIFNAEGRMIKSETKNITQGINRLLLNVSNLPTGAYYIIIVKNEGKETIKFIKQ
jgi:Secretion system C-terminal sorting domain